MLPPISPIKNRSVLKQLSWLPNDVQQLSKHVGKISNSNTKTARGNGTGVLISEDVFMIARHCLSSGKPKFVQFNATNSFYDQGLTFSVLEEIDIHSPTARGLGIKTDPHGDIALLKIAL